MSGYIFRRLVSTLLVLWGTATITFTATFKIGDPVVVLAGRNASPRDREHVRQFYGLDQPVARQYFRYLGYLCRGDMGVSYHYHRSVGQLVAERLPRTLLLGLIALLLQSLIGIGMGVAATAIRGNPADAAILGGSFMLVCMPAFLSAKLLLLGLAYHLGWFPIGGIGEGFLDMLWHVTLPAITLALGGMGWYARLVRNELVDVMASEFILTARAKGLSSAAVLLKHGLRNALLPVVTQLGTAFGALFSGSVIVETIFGWPGIGRLAVESISGLDVPVIVGTVLLATLGVLIGNLLADLAAAALDPRLRML